MAELVASCRTNKEVAAALFLSVKTVEANLSRVYAKLSVRSRTELAASLIAPRQDQGLSSRPPLVSFFSTSMNGASDSPGNTPVDRAT